MRIEMLKKIIDNIIIEQSELDKNFFLSKSDNGESLLIEKELLNDPLDWYEVLSKIESKCGILVNDELMIRNRITYGEFIDIFYNEILRE